MLHTLYVGLGTNLGCKRENLQRAITLLGQRVGKVVSQSAFYQTEPWGFESPHGFLNAVVCLSVPHDDALRLLEQTQQIECEMGRVHKSVGGQYADRLIDIDLLLLDEQAVVLPQLTLPHPLLHQRDFVLLPLVEVAATVWHPVLRKPVYQIYNDWASRGEK